MSTGPQGPVNGSDNHPALPSRRLELVEAIDKALPVEPPANPTEVPWPRIRFFAAREAPKMHSSLPSTYELMWALQLGPILGEGQGVGFSCAQGMSARTLAIALRVVADRCDQIAGCVERREPVPAFKPGGQSAAAAPGQAVDKSANDSAPEPIEGQGTTSPGGKLPGSDT